MSQLAKPAVGTPGSPEHRRAWVTVGLIGAFLLAFACLTPAALRAVDSAYHGRGFEVLQRLMDERDAYPLEHYQAKFWRIALAAAAAGVAATLMVAVSTSGWFFRRFVGEATAGRVGAIRVLVCAILFVDAVTIDLGSAAAFPPHVRLPMGFFHLLSQLPLGLQQLNSSETGLRLWQATTAVLLLLSAAGWRTRWVLPLAAVFYFVQGGILRQYDRLFHTGLTPFYVLVVLCFTRCGDAWSLDRFRRMRHRLPVVPADLKLPAYGWARYLCWVPVVVMYFEAGLTKLRVGGPYWWTGTNLKSILLRDSVENAERRLVFIPQILEVPDVVLSVMGATVLVAELLFFLVLFSVRARQVLPALMIQMHIGIWLLQGIRFFDLVFLNLIFFNWETTRAWAAARLQFARARFARRPDENPPAPEVEALRYRGRLGYPLAGCAIVLVMLGVWSRQIEFYPFSSMNLYANYNGTSVITHYRVLAHDDDGGPQRIYLQDAVNCLRRTMWRQSIARGFAPPGSPPHRMALDYVRACGVAHNLDNPKNPIRKLEVQKLEWDYRRHGVPDVPGGDFGDVAERYVVDIPDSPARMRVARGE